MSKSEIRDLMILAGCPGIPKEADLWCWTEDEMLELLDSHLRHCEIIKQTWRNDK